MGLSDLKNMNFKEEIDKLKDVAVTFYSNYKDTNSEKIRLIDCFIVFNGFLVILQVLYLFFNGLDPVNSFLSAVFSCLGFMTLLVCLRMHVNSKTKLKEFSVEQVYAEFFIACGVLFFVAVNYVG